MRFLYILSLALIISACNLQQEVDIDLPTYEPELQVESYLIPGNPYFVVLSRTSSFFDTLAIEFVEGATMAIQHGTQVDSLYPLDPELLQLFLATDSAGLFSEIIGDDPQVYASLRLAGGAPSIAIIPEDYQSEFRLTVHTEEGDTLIATTRIPRPIPISEQEARFNDDEEALVLTRILDPANEVNFYRRLFQRRRDRADDNGDTIRVTDTEQDFVLDDEFTNGQTVEFGTGFDYQEGDTVIATIYHISEDYYRFIESRDDAIAASLSPFAQPAIIHTNIQGGQGIFVGMTFDQDTFAIER